MPNLVYIGPLILLQKRTFKPILQSQKDEALRLHKDVFIRIVKRMYIYVVRHGTSLNLLCRRLLHGFG